MIRGSKVLQSTRTQSKAKKNSIFVFFLNSTIGSFNWLVWVHPSNIIERVSPPKMAKFGGDTHYIILEGVL